VAWEGPQSLFCTGNAAPRDDGYRGGELLVCKIPARVKFNCFVSDRLVRLSLNSRQGIGLLVQYLWALLKGQDRRPYAAWSVLGLLGTAALLDLDFAARNRLRASPAFG
jgi:hypothetical protein